MTAQYIPSRSASDTEPPNYDLKALGKRITIVANLYKDRKSAALAAGISTDQLARYMRGENQPSFTAMATLAHQHGISLDWLATGNGDMKGGRLDMDLLSLILDTVEAALAEIKIELSPDKKAKLVSLLYSLHEGGNSEAVQMSNVIRLIDYGKNT